MCKIPARLARELLYLGHLRIWDGSVGDRSIHSPQLA